MRLAKLRRALAEEGLDALLVSGPENRRYLSGFTGSTGVLLISADAAFLATDFRYIEQAEKQAPAFEVIKIEDQFVDILPAMVARAGVKKVGFESAHLSVAEYNKWQEVAQDFELVPTENLVEQIRAVKEEAEVEAIRKAVALADAAFLHILNHIQPGMTEKEVAWELESFMRTHGGEKVAFDVIVASGPNGAMPHARPSEKAIREGEPIVMDLGVQLGGYNSDLTRTIYLGKPDEKFKEIYELVLRAQLRAESGAKPGMQAKEVDALARELIAEAGYGQNFGHGLGHGVGLAVHELPRLNKTSEEVLKPGMVFTVEPGIYLPGWGGVRIEDIVLMTDDGAQVLTQASKEPVRSGPV